MKNARLLIVVINFVLIGLLLFAGVSFYTRFTGSDFFKEDEVPDFDPKPLTKKKPVKPTDTYDKYRSLEDLAKKPAEPVPVAEPVEPATPQLQVEVRAVQYKAGDPASSGAHLIARGIPRYLSVGDGQLISQDMPYSLKEIKEDKPDLEYTLVFADEKGQLREAKYRRR